MAYTVLARRYRSQTFDDVVGQDAIAQTLKNAIESGRVAHAYLFTGTRGVGKTTMARILAKSLNCLNAKEPAVKPCLKCDSCLSINTGEDIDVIEIDGASNNSVDNIRDLRQNAIYRPARARFKIYIIDEVHMLSTSAFNALLKILEEPPDHVKFIFATTEPNKVLPTIQSRCQRFDFVNINHEIIAAQLRKILKEEKIEFEEDLIVHLARLASGSMRDGLSLLDQLISTGKQPLSVSLLTEFLGQPDREKLYSLVDKMAAQDGAGVLEGVEKLIDSGQPAGMICNSLLDVIRDLMVMKASGPDSRILILTDQERQSLLKLAGGFDLAGLVYAITALEKLRWSIQNSETGRTLLEAAMLRLTLREHFLGLDQLASPGGGAGNVGLKKNDPLSETSVSAGRTAHSPRVSSAAGFSGPVTLDAIRRHWKTFLERLTDEDGAVVNYLSQGIVSDFSAGRLTIRFNSNALFAMELCRKRQAEIETCLRAVFGEEISPVFESVQEPESRQARPQRTETEVDRRQRAEILDDPKVQMILKELNATPTEIQRMAEEQENPDLEDGEE